MVVQGCDLLVPHAAEVASAVREVLRRHDDLVPLLVATGRARGDAPFADAIEPLLPPPVQRLPDSASVEDIAAVIASASAFVGSSLHGAIAAHAYGRPFVLVNAAGEPKLDGFAAVAGAESRVVRTAADVPAALDAALANRAPQPRPAIDLAREIDAHFDRLADLPARAAVVSRRGSGLRPAAWSWWSRRRRSAAAPAVR